MVRRGLEKRAFGRILPGILESDTEENACDFDRRRIRDDVQRPEPNRRQ